MDSNYFYAKTKHLAPAIHRIIFDASNDNLLSIHFDVVSLLPITITHALQNAGFILHHSTLSYAFPELRQDAKGHQTFSVLKKLTFLCSSDVISIAEPSNAYNLLKEDEESRFDPLDFTAISQELGDVIHSVSTKTIVISAKKTKTHADLPRLQVVIEYYDIEEEDTCTVRSTARQIYHYLIDTMKIAPEELVIIDAMNLERDEFRATQRAMVTKIQTQFYLSCCFGIPIFFIAMIFPFIPGVNGLMTTTPIPGNQTVDISALLLFGLSIPVQFYVARTFYVSCFDALKQKTSNMSTLIVLGTAVAWIYSFIALVLAFFAMEDDSLHGGTHFFETSTTVITVVLLGKWLQAKAKFKTCDALGMLMDLTSPFAVLVHTNEFGEIMSFETDRDGDATEKEISTELIVKGDILKIHRGARVPVDGTIVYGASSMDERMITGESIPRNVTIGDRVISSSINCGDHMMLIRVDKSKSDSVISKIIQLMRSSQTKKPKQQEFADTVSSYFVPVVVCIAVLTFVVWYSLCITGSLPTHYKTGDCAFFAILFSMAVMVIACPCALGLATPAAVMVGMGVAAKYGCLIKGGDVLEVAHSLDIIVFDKTGTLTNGKPKVIEFVMLDKSEDETTLSKQDAIYFAGCSELNSEHPLGKAIVVYAQDRLRNMVCNKELIAPMESENIAGKGIKSTIDGRVVHIGNTKWFFDDEDNENKLNLILPPNVSVDQIKRILKERNSAGNISLLLAIDHTLIAYFCLFDAPRAETKDVIRLLQTKYNKQCVMLTGDNHNTAVAVAKAVGMDENNVISHVLPQDKHQVIKQLQMDSWNLGISSILELNDVKESEDIKYKCKVAMVGDGINDAAALTQADLGIAIGNGTDIAIEAADVILMNDNLWNIGTLIDLSTTIIYRIYWNFVWALGFNSLAIPIAAGVFYPLFQVRLPPQLAAVAMALSSLCVLVSSMWLKTYKSPYAKKNTLKTETRIKACRCGLSCRCKAKITTYESDESGTNPEMETLNTKSSDELENECCCIECECR